MLIRVFFAGPSDTNPVVREVKMQTGYLDLRHVACDAILLRDRAQFQALTAGRGHPSHRRVTSLAFSIIEGSVFYRMSVWIVAGCTRNPPVRGVIEFAVCKPERL